MTTSLADGLQPAAHACRDEDACEGGESDTFGTSSEEESDRESAAAAAWPEHLLPLPRSCRVLPMLLPLPQFMNSRILAVSLESGCAGYAVLGRVQVRGLSTACSTYWSR